MWEGYALSIWGGVSRVLGFDMDCFVFYCALIEVELNGKSFECSSEVAGSSQVGL